MVWLLKRRLKSQDALTRMRAVRRLGEAKAARAIKPLMWALHNDPEARVRVAAAAALAGLNDPRVLNVLSAALKAADPRTRAAAAAALGQTGNRDMVAVLAEALEDGDSQVRRAAGKALDELKWTPADEREGMRHAAAMGRFEELAAQGPEGVGLLLEAVRDSEPQVRRRAASVLGDCNDPRAVRMLVQMTTDGNVAASAVEALGKFLKAGARETPEEALRSVAHLVNVAQFAGERNGANGNRLGRMLTQKRIIDCSDVKRLALQELGRRGVRV